MEGPARDGRYPFNAHFAAGLIKLDQFLNGTNRRMIPCDTKKPGAVDKGDVLDHFRLKAKPSTRQ